MHLLLQAIGGDRALYHTPEQAEAAWRSLDAHSAERFRLAYAAGGFVTHGVFPLRARYPERVAELRLAGDAINVYTAKAFIEAYLGCRG